MVKINEILNYKGDNYKRLSIQRIKSMLLGNSLFNRVENRKTIEIFAIPCKANINSPWIEFFTCDCVAVEDFTKFVNSCTIYNCNNEMGKYLHYYIKTK